MKKLERLLNPRGIAVVGASTGATRPGGQVLAALINRGYPGHIYPVNPKYQELAGLACYPSVRALPEPCDVAVIAVPAEHVPATVAECGDKGVGFAVVLGGGFREAGEGGHQIESELIRVAKEKGVRLVGPNCLGFVNLPDRVFAGFGSLVRPPFLKPGVVSAVLQSGGFGNSLTMRCGAAGIGFRHVFTSGNEADLSAADLIEACVDDPGTRIIVTYLEGVRDGRAFMAAVQRALAAGKPVIAWKAGNSPQGARAAASHTANMTGAYDVFRAMFRQCGVIEIHDVEDIVDFIQALLGERPARGRNVAVMGGSGGSAVVFSDAADRYDLRLAPLAAETKTVLTQNLPSIASLDNPIDFAGAFASEANAARMLAAIEAVLADPGIDQLAMMLATVVGGPFRAVANALAEAANPRKKPIFVFSASPRDASPEGFDILEAAKIPVIASPNRVAQAMGMLADHAQALAAIRTEAAGPAAAPVAAFPIRSDSVLDEVQSKALIAAMGVPVTQDRMFPPAQIEMGTPDLPFPLAVKIVSPDIAHKSDIGGVKLDVRDSSQLAEASRAILENVGRAAPKARLAGLLVSEMVQGGLETIVGVVNDETFGPVVAFGLGGLFAEALKDMSYRVAPFDLETAHSMIRELRSSALFGGLRGQAPRDVDAVASTLVAISEAAWQLRDQLEELDINPLLVRERGRGVVAVDALAILRAPR